MRAGHQCCAPSLQPYFANFPGPMRLGCLSHPSTPCPSWGGDTNIFRVSLFLFFWPVPDCLKCTSIISLVKWVNPLHLPLGYCAGDSWGVFCNIHGQNLCPSCFMGWGGGLYLSPGSTEFSILWQATTAWLCVCSERQEYFKRWRNSGMQGPNTTFFYPSSIFSYSSFQEQKETHVPVSLDSQWVWNHGF